MNLFASHCPPHSHKRTQFPTTNSHFHPYNYCNTHPQQLDPTNSMSAYASNLFFDDDLPKITEPKPIPLSTSPPRFTDYYPASNNSPAPSSASSGTRQSFSDSFRYSSSNCIDHDHDLPPSNRGLNNYYSPPSPTRFPTFEVMSPVTSHQLNNCVHSPSPPPRLSIDLVAVTLEDASTSNLFFLHNNHRSCSSPRSPTLSIKHKNTQTILSTISASIFGGSDSIPPPPPPLCLMRVSSLSSLLICKRNCITFELRVHHYDGRSYTAYRTLQELEKTLVCLEDSRASREGDEISIDGCIDGQARCGKSLSSSSSCNSQLAFTKGVDLDLTKILFNLQRPDMHDQNVGSPVQESENASFMLQGVLDEVQTRTKAWLEDITAVFNKDIDRMEREGEGGCCGCDAFCRSASSSSTIKESHFSQTTPCSPLCAFLNFIYEPMVKERGALLSNIQESDDLTRLREEGEREDSGI